MNKNFYIATIILSAVFFVGYANVFAEENGERSSEQQRNNASGVVGELQKVDDEDIDTGEEVTATAQEGENAVSEVSEKISEQHRNNVSKVVKELQKVAEKDDDIGEEVKAVAQEEEDSVAGVSEKMAKVENRGGFKTFLFGSDYKNLGALRSELAITQNHIDRLTKSMERATSTETKAELQTQINELSGIQTKAETFIKDQEGKFSLFGWLVKMFQ